MKNKINFQNTCYLVQLVLILVLICNHTNLYSQKWDRVQANRMIWFYGPRSFPVANVPQGAYSRAIDQYVQVAQSNGYYSPLESWKCIGPKPGIMGPIVSGRIASLKFNPGDITGMTIFAAGADGGVWKTTDGGTTWKAKTDNLTSLSSGALAIGQNSSGQYMNIYYGTGESHFGFNFCYYGDGFYKSTDNGETWYKIISPNLPSEPTYFSRIAIRPGHPNELLAACGTNHTNISYEGGLYRSTDYGETWQNRLVPDPGLEGRVCNDVVFSPDGSKAYITGPDEGGEQIYEKGVHYRISTDGGTNFGPPRDDIIRLQGRSHIAVCNADPNRVYIFSHIIDKCPLGSCSGTSSTAVLYMSTDAGQSFTARYSFLAYACSCAGGDAYQSWYDMFLYVSPQNPDIVYIGLINMWKSTDGGVNFQTITPTHVDMQNMDLDPNNPNHIIVGSDGGFYRSTTGGNNQNWLNLNDQLALTQLYRIASSPFNPEIIVAGSQDNGIQSKYEFTDDWRDVLGGNDGTTVVYSQIFPNIIFAGFGNYTPTGPPPIVRSSNSGDSFHPSYQPPNSIWDSQNDWIPPIASAVTGGPPFMETFYTARRCLISPENEQIIIKFFYTTNSGENWYQFGNSILSNESPQNLSISTADPEIMYLSTGSYAWPYVNQKLYKSTDAGYNWREIINNSSTEVPNRFITHIEIDPSDKDVVLITLSGFNSTTPGKRGHIFRSDNGGSNWVDVSETLPDIPVNDLVIVYPGVKFYVIGTDAGVLVTSDGGGTWREMGPDLPHAVVTDVEYLPIFGLIRAGTFGRSVWEHFIISTSLNINYTQYLNSDANGLKIDRDIIVERGGKLVIPFGCTIRMAANKKIIIKEGGEINASNGNIINFTSISGKWGGIEIQGNAKVSNCIFSNTESPLTIAGSQKNTEHIMISECTFNEGNMIVIGRNNLSISGCKFNGGSSFTGSALSIVYGNNIRITNNIISSAFYSGISVSNSNVFVNNNKIYCDKGSVTPAGISFDNCSDGKVIGNQFYGFRNNIYLFKSIIDASENDKEYNATAKDQKQKTSYTGKIRKLLNDINYAKDKTDSLSAELNLIEILMLTGNKNIDILDDKYNDLIPGSSANGIRMINEKLFGKNIGGKVENIPEKFRLSQNYPNPFNPVTRFEYQIAEAGFVKVKIYDVLGEEIEVLVNEHLQQGVYESFWNAEKFSSGIYFYSISVSDKNGRIIFTDSKRMVLIK